MWRVPQVRSRNPIRGGDDPKWGRSATGEKPPMRNVYNPLRHSGYFVAGFLQFSERRTATLPNNTNLWARAIIYKRISQDFHTCTVHSLLFVNQPMKAQL